MKIRNLVIAANIVIASTALGGETGNNRDELVTKNQKKVFKCVRSIVESRRVDETLLKDAAKLLNAAREKNGATNDMIKACGALKEQAHELTKLTTKEVEAVIAKLDDYNSNTPYHHEYYIMSGINRPDYQCHTYSVKAIAGLGFALEAGMGAGTCAGSNGRTYVVLLPEVGYGIGGGVIATVADKKFRLYSNDKWIKRDGGIYIGMIIAGNLENDRELGLGLGIILTDEVYVTLKLVPVKNNFKDWLKQNTNASL